MERRRGRDGEERGGGKDKSMADELLLQCEDVASVRAKLLWLVLPPQPRLPESDVVIYEFWFPNRPEIWKE